MNNDLLYQKLNSSAEMQFYIQQTEVTNILTNCPSEQEKRAIGCMMGSYIGDSIGTYVEFQKYVPQNVADQALSAQGGGPHRVARGQGTDDSELATSLGYGLLNSEQNAINLNMITKFYVIWLKSNPFDKGSTITKPMNVLVNDPEINYNLSRDKANQRNYSAEMINLAITSNAQSESNGGCMRISPLIVYLSKLTSQDEIKKAVISEQQLTHTNVIAQYCSYIYTRVCINLIQNGNPKMAFDDIRNYIENIMNIGVIQEWWREHVLTEKFTDTTVFEVWIKHQLVITLIFLKRLAEDKEQINDSLFQSVLKQVIMMGGDTDTNGAIVSGMIGALVGYEKIPRLYQNAILNCELQMSSPQVQRPRPPLYNPRASIFLAHRLFNNAPTEKVQIIGGNKPNQGFSILNQYYQF